MDLKATLAALRTGWHLLVIGALIAGTVAVALDRAAVPVYEARASYVVSPGTGIDPDDVARGVDTLDSTRSRSIMSTLTEIAKSDAVRSEALSTLDLAPELAESYSVEAIVVPEANVMETAVTGPDPEIAAALASAIGEIGGSRFVELYQIYDVEGLDLATVPTEAANPGLGQMLVIAVAIGLMVGMGAALLRSAWIARARRAMSNRLDAYGPTVTPIKEHDRFERVG